MKATLEIPTPTVTVTMTQDEALLIRGFMGRLSRNRVAQILQRKSTIQSPPRPQVPSVSVQESTYKATAQLYSALLDMTEVD